MGSGGEFLLHRVAEPFFHRLLFLANEFVELFRQTRGDWNHDTRVNLIELHFDGFGLVPHIGDAVRVPVFAFLESKGNVLAGQLEPFPFHPNYILQKLAKVAKDLYEFFALFASFCSKISAAVCTFQNETTDSVNQFHLVKIDEQPNRRIK